MQWFIFISMATLFIVTPYQKGLYFIEDFYSIAFIILALFIILFLRLILYKEVHLLGKAYIVLLLPLSYLLSLPLAESPAGAWDSLIRWSTYSAFFLLLHWSTLHLKIKKWMPIIFHITGMWIAIHMIFAKLDWLTFHNSSLAGRFAGVFQYPNTFGMIMALFFLYSLTMLTKTTLSYRYVALYSFPLVLYLISFLLSYSRGILVILPVVWFIGLILLPIKKQIEYLTFTLISTLSTLLLFKLITTNDSMNPVLLLVIVLTSTILIVGTKTILNQKVFTIPKLQTLFAKKAIRFLLPAILIAIGLAGILDLKNDGLIYKALPEQLQERVDSMSLSTSTAKERFLLVEDSLQLSKESPILGFGGQAWASIYKNYQQTPYSSNKIHNGYLEWLVDTGWVGIFLLTFVFGYFLYHIISTLLKKVSSFHVAITLSLLTIFIHSLIDFNFSYGTVWLLVFWLLAMGLEPTATTSNKKFLHKLPTISLILFTVIVSINLVFSYKFMQAAQDFKKAKQTNSLTVKKELLESAVQQNPYNLNYRFQLSDIYVLIIENYDEQEINSELQKLIDKTTALESKNPDVWWKAAELSMKLGDKKQAIHYYNQALKHDHFNTKLYEMTMTSKVNLALEDNNESYAISAIDDFEKMTRLNKQFEQKSLSAAHNSRDFHITNEIYYQASLAYYLTEQYDNIIRIYENHRAPDTKMNAIAILAYEKSGEQDKADELNRANESDELADYVNKLENIFNN